MPMRSTNFALGPVLVCIRVVTAESCCLLPMIAVALVVDDVNKGNKLVLRYPPPPPPSAQSSSSTGASVAGAAQNPFLRIVESTGGGVGDLGSEAGTPRSRFYEMPPAFFARMFRPKNTLCGAIFELSIEDLHFVSHPVQPSLGPRGRQSDIGAFNVVFVLEKPSDLSQGSGGHGAYGGDPYDSASSYGHGGPGRFDMYKSAAAQLAKALCHEEQLSGYVHKEVQLMLNTIDELVNKAELEALDMGGGGGDGGGVGGGGEDGLAAGSDAATLGPVTTGTLLERSALARDLCEVFHALTDSAAAARTAHDTTKMAPSSLRSKRFSDRSGGGGGGGGGAGGGGEGGRGGGSAAAREGSTAEQWLRRRRRRHGGVGAGVGGAGGGAPLGGRYVSVSNSAILESIQIHSNLSLFPWFRVCTQTRSDLKRVV